MTTTAAKLVLVTGANKGIGLEVAKSLAQQGCTVLLGARDLSRGEQAAEKLGQQGVNVTPIHLDLGDPASIRAASEQIAEQHGRLDVLVNNAGIADKADGPPSKADISAVERILRTNLLGSIAVTQAMLPLLHKSEAGRIVNVSSGLASLTIASDPEHFYSGILSIGYCASKAALNMFTVKLARELAGTTIKVNSADPGYTATDLNGHSGYQTIEQGAAETIRLALLPDDGPTGSFSDMAGQVAW